MNAQIILSTINARYTHASLALRYLYANLGEFRDLASIKEFVINEDMERVCEDILASNPKIVGIGVYIWNALDAKELLDLIKAVSPETTVILGGPEVSYLPHRVDYSNADYIISGEGEEAFYNLTKELMSGEKPKERFIKADLLDLKKVVLPYRYYNDEDIANRYLYIEASRGCPFDCEFCLSSLDERVRYFDIDLLLGELDNLWSRGARRFKFVDRTLNINIALATKLMDFFLSKPPIYKLHFEVIPESFPAALREKIKQFAPNILQLEIGIQTLNSDIAQKISRKMNFAKIKENIHFLENETNAHLHLDLIVGLPDEDLSSFGDGLNELYKLSRSEIQIGILKKLSGTAIVRHDIEYGMVYSTKPPYNILKTHAVSFEDMQRMKRFARYWEITHNSERFKQTMELIFGDNLFVNFLAFSDWIYANFQMTHQISFRRLCEMIFEYLTAIKGFDPLFVAKTIANDSNSFNGDGMPKVIADLVKGEGRREKGEGD